MDTGHVLTRATACLAFVGYVAALTLRIRGGPRSGPVLWAASAALFLIHVICAFHFVHHWSHQAAYAATARQTAEMTGQSSGSGLYLNYAVMIIWPAHSLASWRATPLPRWIDLTMHVFLAFMWFNATVVFGHGPARWLGIAATVLLLIAWAKHRHGSSESHR